MVSSILMIQTQIGSMYTISSVVFSSGEACGVKHAIISFNDRVEV